MYGHSRYAVGSLCRGILYVVGGNNIVVVVGGSGVVLVLRRSWGTDLIIPSIICSGQVAGCSRGQTVIIP